MSPVALAPNPVPLNVGARPYALKSPPSATPSTNPIASAIPASASTNPQLTLSPNAAPVWRPKQVELPKRTAFSFDTMPEALEAFANGEFLVVMDDENRENEGDLIIAANQCTREKMAWMIKHTSGFICVALPGSRLEELQIPMMVPDNQERHQTAYTVTVDYKHGTTTGISASDRSLTVRALASPHVLPTDFNRPGHMVPLRAREGGVLTRKGHTEASVDLCLLTNQPLSGVLCELVNDDSTGSMARRDDCRAFADRWGLRMISVEMLAQWKRNIWLPQQGQNGSPASAQL